MLEALWSAEFESSQGVYGAGVAIFETGRIFGGDAKYYYIGKTDLQGDMVHVDLQINHYAGQPYSVFGAARQFHLKLSGKVQVPVMDLHGHLVGDPKQKIHIRCTKRADLP